MDSNTYSTAEFRDKLYDEIHVTTKDTIILMCAILIASIGLNMNSTAVIIGAMLISPLMSPIVGVGLGVAIYDVRLIKQSLTLLATQVGVSLIVSALYFWISPIEHAGNELVARTSPTIWDILIAIAGGTAGVIGSRKKDANNIVPGVAIATALMPPICTAGYGIATLNSKFLIGALYLFMINFIFIMLANFVGTRILMRKSAKELLKDINHRVKITFLSLIVILVVPSLYSATTLALDYAKTDSINKYVQDKFKNHTVLEKHFDKNTKTLEITILGEPLSYKDMDNIKQDIESYNIKDIDVKINQVLGATDDEVKNKEIYKHIDKYIEQKLENKKNNQ